MCSHNHTSPLSFYPLVSFISNYFILVPLRYAYSSTTAQGKLQIWLNEKIVKNAFILKTNCVPCITVIIDSHRLVVNVTCKYYDKYYCLAVIVSLSFLISLPKISIISTKTNLWPYAYFTSPEKNKIGNQRFSNVTK